MKKSLAFLLLVGITFSGVTLSTQAISESKKGSISVNATEYMEVSPDVAEISFAVQTFDTKSMQKATLDNKNIADKVLAELNKVIDSKNGDYIKTSDFTASPVYSYTGSKKVFDKYSVSNRVIVHTKSIDKVGEMIDKAIIAGATNVDSLTFSASNYEAQCNELVTLASAKAKSRASVIAKAMGTSLDGIENVSMNCSANNYTPRNLYMAKNMMADAAAESASGIGTTISSGSVKINANINASFYVK